MTAIPHETQKEIPGKSFMAFTACHGARYRYYVIFKMRSCVIVPANAICLVMHLSKCASRGKTVGIRITP